MNRVFNKTTEVKIVRLTTGEELLCNVTDTQKGIVQLSDIAILIPTEEGIGLMHFMPYADHSEGLAIIWDHVIFTIDADPNLVAQWNKMFQKIVTAPTMKIIT